MLSSLEAQLIRLDCGDGTLRSDVYTLLDTAFPRISERIQIAANLGAHWHEVSTAFVAVADGSLVAHVGVLPIPLVVNGQRSVIAGIHAVCTRPDVRGKGLARALLTQALDFVDQHFRASVLTTSIPVLYARFGFRLVREVLFSCNTRSPNRDGARTRRIDAADPSDLKLLQNLLSDRQPVSLVLSSVDPGWLFLINEVLASWGVKRVYYSEDLDVAMVLESRGRTLKVLDVVGPVIPDLPTLVAVMPGSFDRLELHFAPDRVRNRSLAPIPTGSDDGLMVRGQIELAPEVVLPPLARC